MSPTVTRLRAKTYEESLALRVHAGYTPRQKWQRRMACTGLQDHPKPQELCATCPVRLDCLTWVMGNEQTLQSCYIVGHAAIREEIRVRLRLPRVKPSKCGSDAGYQAHWRDGEDPCDGCKEAHAAKRGGLRQAAT